MCMRGDSVGTGGSRLGCTGWHACGGTGGLTCAAPGVSGTARLTTDTWTHGGSATCSSSRTRGRSAAERMSTTGSCASIIWLSRRSSETTRSARVCSDEIVISSKISETQA